MAPQDSLRPEAQELRLSAWSAPKAVPELGFVREPELARRFVAIRRVGQQGLLRTVPVEPVVCLEPAVLAERVFWLSGVAVAPAFRR